MLLPSIGCNCEAIQWLHVSLSTFLVIMLSQFVDLTIQDVETFLYRRVIVFICVCGVLGNLLNLIVLTRKGLQRSMDRMEKSAHVGK